MLLSLGCPQITYDRSTRHRRSDHWRRPMFLRTFPRIARLWRTFR